ncbi:HTH DNA binding protein [Bacillus phage Eldridge]|uniref:CRISPR/Cas system-associated transcriptional regulator CasRa n=1 Tax=Bacillus phage Eldridge TaxID=1776293 RepID=A0A0Y0C554_9CAUD|nr:HTH DNA binding protein [Bacillus phage Eldridge]AMB18675.1 CRISPR/Cas system-associated transcriptional regulator CasRa [Bacillus phage Eldridge]
MTENVYVNLSVVDLKPAVLNFLSELADTAKESVFVTRMKDLAAELGRDIRTVQRYMKELTSKEIIELKGRKGRGGATVIRFNAELIQFTTSDKALVNSEEPIDIDELLQTKIPKKKPEHNPNKRPRRTKTQMAEAKLLQDEKQVKIDKLNGQLQMLGGVPNWEWFQQTDNPVGNYKTYLLSRLYNRYAALYIDRHNARALVLKKGTAVDKVSEYYDVLGLDKVIGTSRWAQFESFRLFCEENNIDPASYLTAQFNRSTLNPKGTNPSKLLPFVNALISDASYKVYQDFCDYEERRDPDTTFYNALPFDFASDFVVQAIRSAYYNAHESNGLLPYRGAIKELLKETHYKTDGQRALAAYYYTIVDDMKNKGVSKKDQETIKKFYIMQCLIQTEGRSALPYHVILGSSITQWALATYEHSGLPREDIKKYKAVLLSSLVLPNATNEVKQAEGANLYYSMETLAETRQVLALIQQQQGLYLNIGDVQDALKAYDKHKVPVCDLSMLDVQEIVKHGGVQAEVGIDLQSITQTEKKDKIVFQGSVNEGGTVDNLLNSLNLG